MQWRLEANNMTRPPRITPISINLAPMVDVMMCMLIFFMLATKMVERENSTIDLPLALAAKEVDKSELGNRFVVNVRKTEAGVEYVISQDVVSAENLRILLHTAVMDAKDKADINFIIRAERNVAYRHIENLLKLCRDEKVRNVTFSALQGEGGA